MPRIIWMLLALILLTACDDKLVYSEIKPTEGGSWSSGDVKEFDLAVPDTLTDHQIYFLIRNDNTFPYSNLFLIAELEFPDGQVVKDTLEYEMARPDGSWMGKGIGSSIENRLWYKENVIFALDGVYTLKLSHAMRQNGEVEGIVNLQGITDVGVEVEKTK